MKNLSGNSLSGKRVVIKGVPVVPGLNIGVIHKYKDVLSRKQTTYYLKDSELTKEVKRFRKALETAKKNITSVGKHFDKKLNNGSAQIFTFQQLSLQDGGFSAEVENEIVKRKINAEAVIRDIIERKENQIRNSKLVQIQQKADDLRNVKRFLLEALFETQSVIKCEGNKNHVIFAKRLLPSDAIHFGKSRMVALVTEEGGQDSHVALLAREYSIPFVTSIDMERYAVEDGQTVIVDGDHGKIILNPSENEKDEYRQIIESRKEQLKKILIKTKDKSLKFKGNRICIMANNFGPADVKISRKYGAQGIGLYRLEGLFMSMYKEPTSEQIYENLKKSLVSMKGKPVTLRLLDTGADKSIPSMPFTFENVSPLGLRGIRLLFKHEKILRAQLTAFIRLAEHFNIQILIPLVTTAEDIRKTRKIFREEINQLQASGLHLKKEPLLGAMIETPAAVCLADKIIELSDFVSIGTNDLLQYTMVLDRDDFMLKEYYKEGVKIILPMISSVIEKASSQGKQCSVCGELAANTSYTKKLLECGLQNFSVTPSSIPYVKEKILEISGKLEGK